MEALKRYIKEKEKNLKYKSSVITTTINKKPKSDIIKEKFLFNSRTLSKKILFLVNQKNAFEFIYEDLKYSKVQKDYRVKIMNLFDKYFAYIEKNRINTIKKYDKKKNEIFFSLDKIDIDDVYIFFSNYYYTNSEGKSKNYNLSRMRKYIRLLNEEPNIDYKYKIDFKNKKNKANLTPLEQILLIKFLKEKEDLQPLLLFYFLYYLGITFSTISRIKINHFRKSLHYLKIKKGKMKNYKIIEIMTKNIHEFIMNKSNETNYLFYDNFVNKEKMTRVNYIKEKFLDILKEYNKFSSKQIEILMKSFSKTRVPKRLTSSFKMVFDLNIEIDEDFIKSELDDFPYKDENLFSVDSWILGEENNKNINENMINLENEKIISKKTPLKADCMNTEKINNNIVIEDKDLIDLVENRSLLFDSNGEGFLKIESKENSLDNLTSYCIDN